MPALTAEQRVELRRHYAAGERQCALARAFNLSPEGVRQIIIRAGMTIRPREGELRKHTCNFRFFQRITSEAKAYWLGFLAADGAISKGRLVKLTLQRRDRDHLERLNLALSSTYPIYDYVSRGGGAVTRSDRIYPMSVVSKCSAEMASDLARYGVVQGKGESLRWPTNMPDHLLRHYLRGYFDGDGNVVLPRKTTQLTHCIAANWGFATECQLYLVRAIGLRRIKIYPQNNGRLAVIRYGGRLQAARIYHLLYDGATVWLPRKREKAAPFVT